MADPALFTLAGDRLFFTAVDDDHGRELWVLPLGGLAPSFRRGDPNSSGGCFQPYVSVLRDPQTRRFRMWYNSAVSSSQSHIGYLESEDP